MVDVLVVGGGPVGLAAAIDARQRGMSVLVVDPRESADGVDKACGEGLMPGALAALHRLGVHPDGRAYAGIAYLDAIGHRVEHRFRHAPGRGVRRTVLHAALSSRAEKAGVDRLPSRVKGLSQLGSRVDVRTGAGDVRARWVLAADGLHSSIRESLGLGRPASGRRGVHRRYGQRRHYRLPPWSDLVEVHWTPQAELYVTPVADDLVGVAVLAERGVRYSDALAGLPALSERLRNATEDGPVLGAGPLRQKTSARVSGRVLLVGDASGYVDALTGEGIRVGLAQAQAAVACVAEDRPGDYEQAWARATRDYRVLTSGLLAAALSPLRPAIVPAARALPAVYGLAVERLAR